MSPSQTDKVAIEKEITALLDANKSITAVTVTNGQGQVIFQTSNWDITSDIVTLLNSWRQQAPSVTVQGIKYSVLQCTPERLVSTNVLGMGHVVGANRSDKQFTIAYVTPEGGAGVAFMDAARANDAIAKLRPEVISRAVEVEVEVPAPASEEEPVAVEAKGPVPSSTWATAASDTDMKNLLWELDEFSKYVSRGDFNRFLQSLLTEGDQVKIWELIKTLRSLRNFIERTEVIY